MSSPKKTEQQVTCIHCGKPGHGRRRHFPCPNDRGVRLAKRLERNLARNTTLDEAAAALEQYAREQYPVVEYGDVLRRGAQLIRKLKVTL